jgi:acetyl-CoA C-acetyltransferase
VIGAALQQGVQTTIGRTAALRAGLPVTVSGMSIDRHCASGLMAIATAAKQVIVDRMDICVAGGVESISLVQTPKCGSGRSGAPVHAQRRLHADDQHRRGGRQALLGQPRAARTPMRFARSSSPPRRRPRASSTTRSSRHAKMTVKDKATGETSMKEITSPRTRAIVRRRRSRSRLAAAGDGVPEAMITAGNASQLSDGARPA